MNPPSSAVTCLARKSFSSQAHKAFQRISVPWHTLFVCKLKRGLSDAMDFTCACCSIAWRTGESFSLQARKGFQRISFLWHTLFDCCLKQVWYLALQGPRDKTRIYPLENGLAALLLWNVILEELETATNADLWDQPYHLCVVVLLGESAKLKRQPLWSTGHSSLNRELSISETQCLGAQSAQHSFWGWMRVLLIRSVADLQLVWQPDSLKKKRWAFRSWSKHVSAFRFRRNIFVVLDFGVDLRTWRYDVFFETTESTKILISETNEKPAILFLCVDADKPTEFVDNVHNSFRIVRIYVPALIPPNWRLLFHCWGAAVWFRKISCYSRRDNDLIFWRPKICVVPLEPTKLAAQTQTYSGIFTNWLEKFYELPFPTIV